VLHISYSQVPGYVGKKFSVKLGSSFMPAFFQPVYANADIGGNWIDFYGLFARYHLNLDYVVTRKSTVGFAFHYAPVASRVTLTNPVTLTSKNALMGVNGLDIGFYFRTFFGNYVAPVGNYYKIEAGAHIIQLDDRAENFTAYSYEPVGATAYIINSFGRQHIFSNIVTFDYGLDLGIVLPPYGLDDPYYALGQANRRMTLGYIFTMYAQVGLNFGKNKMKRSSGWDD